MVNVDKEKLKLRKHVSGNWYVRIADKFHYFGKDEAVAKERWLLEKRFILAGTQRDRHANPSDSWYWRPA